MADLAFVKMEGCGNDYVFVDVGLTAAGGALPEGADPAVLSRAMANRHTGVGSDGLILIDSGSAPGRVAMRMWNADGSEGKLCLNGLRCVALYAAAREAVPAAGFTVETAAGPREARVELSDPRKGIVEVEAGLPDFRRASLPASGDEDEFWDEPVEAEETENRAFGVSVGNPHVVLWTRNPAVLARAPLDRIGPALEKDSRFPEGVNVHLAAAPTPERVTMRSWERGSGLTLACGSGAVAVFAVARRLGRVWDHADVAMPGGRVSLTETAEGMRLRGPAREVFSGTWPL